jgi:hypothetical protein
MYMVIDQLKYNKKINTLMMKTIYGFHLHVNNICKGYLPYEKM